MRPSSDDARTVGLSAIMFTEDICLHLHTREDLQ